VKKNHDECNKRGVNIDKNGNSVASLEVEIMMAKDLPKMDWYSGKCDPYVILSLSPPAACLDQSDKRTKVKPRERSPVWNQSFVFKPIEFRNADLVLTIMDAENFGNDDFMGKIIIPLKNMEVQHWVEKWYQLTDPEKKTEAKQLSGSVLVRTKFVFSEKSRLDGEIKEIKASKEKLELDMKKIQTHISRLEGKEGSRKGSATDDVWLFADFDDETPFLFTDIEPEVIGVSSTGGGLVSKHDMCVVL
jgi:Ca2+-dependent lipid-binding protein